MRRVTLWLAALVGVATVVVAVRGDLWVLQAALPGGPDWPFPEHHGFEDMVAWAGPGHADEFWCVIATVEGRAGRFTGATRGYALRPPDRPARPRGQLRDFELHTTERVYQLNFVEHGFQYGRTFDGSPMTMSYTDGCRGDRPWRQ